VILGTPFFRAFSVLFKTSGQIKVSVNQFSDYASKTQVSEDQMGTNTLVLILYLVGCALILIGIIIKCYCLRKKRNEAKVTHPYLQDQLPDEPTDPEMINRLID
jgi:hypothetical protein